MILTLNKSFITFLIFPLIYFREDSLLLLSISLSLSFDIIFIFESSFLENISLLLFLSCFLSSLIISFSKRLLFFFSFKVFENIILISLELLTF